ncbi:unnamed protein product [Rotaria sp. Silwood2]|nr:unnamed protein product [Rotaria sp. Silwood2]CAF4370753.1 unnamed protein product [Rotaria sp. Silwood2]
MIKVNTYNASAIVCDGHALNIRQVNPHIAMPIDFLCIIFVIDNKHEKKAKTVYASNNVNGRNKSKASYGNVNDYLVRSYNSATSTIRILSDDDIINELSIISCSSLTCLLFNEFIFSFGHCNNL